MLLWLSKMNKKVGATKYNLMVERKRKLEKQITTKI